jgi:two-component system chemotaxis sensor kinase CheA
MSTNNDQDAEFIAQMLPTFVSEAKEQLDALESLLLKLEDAPADRELLDALFRCAHTVKGSAGLFGLDHVVAFTHHLETLLDLMREDQCPWSSEISTLLLECTDEIGRLIQVGPGEPGSGGAVGRIDLVKRLQEACAGRETQGEGATSAPVSGASIIEHSEPSQGWRIEAAFGPDTFRNGLDPVALLAHLSGFGRIHNAQTDLARVPSIEDLDPESCHLRLHFDFDSTVTRERIDTAFSFVKDDCTYEVLSLGAATHKVEAVKNAFKEHETKAPSTKVAGPDTTESTKFIRVQADRLDTVINLLGELVIAGAGAEMLARQSGQAPLLEANRQISQLVEEIRNGTMQLRMVPIGETFARFRRTVRDVAASLDKDVLLEIEGGETELDKSVVERITDPLMHLVRNALDHGLETPEQRAASGKSTQGRLKLAAHHDSGNIVIRIEDDGRGIDRQRVLERAWERGLVERGVVPPDAEILALIFRPGFSTAESVTNLSGRGVGMDVVLKNIEALRGSVSVLSDQGQGTTVEVRLPLTLAIIDGFLVSVGRAKFIFPLDSVIEVIKDSAARLDDRGRGVIELRGHPLPVVDLRALYGLEGTPSERASVVVIQAGEDTYGVRVDALLGQHQTVIKPLGRMFRSLRGMAGSSILGNGEVALICDVNSLCGLAMDSTPPHTARSNSSDSSGSELVLSSTN